MTTDATAYSLECDMLKAISVTANRSLILAALPCSLTVGARPRRRTTSISRHHAAQTDPQCLHHRLLGGEARRQLRRPPPAVIEFLLCVYAAKETVAPAIYGSGYAANFDDVNADSKHEGDYN